MEKNIRTIRVSDDIWEEFMRLRSDKLVGGQQTWDELFNTLLVIWHGNGDWRNKVKSVDNVAKQRLGEWVHKQKDFDLEKTLKKYKEIESTLYNEFVKDQDFLINTKAGMKKYGIKVKTHKSENGFIWYCGKCDSEIETDGKCEPPCNCDFV